MNDTTPGTGDRGTSQVAREQGQQVKGSAQDAASNVAGTAGDKARDLRGQAGQHARGIANEATRQLRGRAQDETDRAGQGLSAAGGQLQALAEGRIDDAGVFGDYARQAADAVNQWAETVQNRGFDGLIDDARGFARRRPGVFLAGAVAAGLLAGRLGRNLREEMSDDSGSGTSGSGTTGASSTSGTSGALSAGSTGQRGSSTPSTPPTTPPRKTSASGDDDLIVGRQTVDPTSGRSRDDVDYEPIDVNRGRNS